MRMAALIMLLISIGFHAESCLAKAVDDQQRSDAMASPAIEEVLKKHTEEILSIPGVVGIGQGLCNEEPCIKIYIIKKSPARDKIIPSSLDGYKVSTEVTGEVRAHTDK